MVPHDLLSAGTEAGGAALDDVGDRLRRALSPRYAVQRKLARGSMGLVFLAHDTRHDRLVAIKLLDPERAAAIGAERFRREIQAAAQLVHPNILPVFESGDADGLLYYVMPYVEGDSLRDLLARDGPLPVEAAVALAGDLAEALDCAHAHGVIHRDVKPENVLLPAPHHACLTDFGVAHSPAGPDDPHLTSAGRLLGSPLYMSPEQAAGYADVDGRADIYGLGCVLFEMLTGRPPFTGERVEAVLIGHLSESPPLLRALRPDAPPWLEAVVARTLAKVPDERFATAGELAERLKNGWKTAAGETAVPLAPTAGPVSRRRVGRPAMAAAGLALLALAAVGAGVWLWRTAHPRASRLNPNHIAVLYFEDLSPGKKLGYLASGMTEALIDQLSRVRGLDVVSPNGVKPYREKDVPPDSIARALRVGTIVEGSVDSAGDRLRISARLVDAASGSRLESTAVEKKSGDLFALKDSVGEAVARFLRLRLGEEIQVRRLQAETRNASAWRYYHEGEQILIGLTDIQPYADSTGLAVASGLLSRGDSLLARAEAADPAWVAPTVERGMVAIRQADLRQLDPAWTRRWLAVGSQLAARAARRAPGDARVLELSGRLALRMSGSESDAGRVRLLHAQAERDLTAATHSDPARASAWALLSRLMLSEGRYQEAILVGSRALAEDAYLRDANLILNRLFFAAFELGDLAAAERWCARAEREFPGDPLSAECRLQLMATDGSPAPAPARAWRLVAEVDRLGANGYPAELDPDLVIWRRTLVAGVLARAGLPDSARAVLKRIERDASSDPELLRARFSCYAARVELLLGDRERALDWLRLYLRAQPTERQSVARMFVFRTLHGDPRFDSLVRLPRQ